MPSSKKRPCAIVIVVFATITEGTLVSSGTRPRRSQALTASPPSAAVGVATLNASPASRTQRGVRKATPSWRNAKRQPSVSNTMTSTTGKQRTIASRQESWTNEARIAAGSFVATRTASRPAPKTSSAARRERGADVPIDDEEDTDLAARAPPAPPGETSPAPRKPEEDQRPVARPARAAGRVDDREQPHGEHEQPGDVVVELGPRAVRGGPRGVTVVHGQRLDRRRRERRPLGGEPHDDLGERRAVRDHVDRGRERGQRRRDEQGREAEAELDLDEPTEPRGADVGLRREPAHRDEVHRAEEQEGGEDRHLGEHHHAVRGPEQREDAADEREREREAAGHEDPDRRERERREASEQERRPQALAPPEPRDDEVREAADPRRCRELVDAIERQ